MYQRTECLSSNAAMIRLDMYDKDCAGIWGKVYNMYFQEAIECLDAMDFLLKVDALYDELQFPMAFMRHRSFERPAGSPGKRGRPSGMSMEEDVNPAKEHTAFYDPNTFNPYYWSRMHGDLEPLHGTHGDCKPIAVFYIRTVYRQNASWQGEVFWYFKAQKMKKATYRSALELFYYIQSALDIMKGVEQFGNEKRALPGAGRTAEKQLRS